MSMTFYFRYTIDRCMIPENAHAIKHGMQLNRSRKKMNRWSNEIERNLEKTNAQTVRIDYWTDTFSYSCVKIS